MGLKPADVDTRKTTESLDESSDVETRSRKSTKLGD
jgi:hypothetical protein